MENKKSVLYHHGIKGQRWGVRRYQNPDGSLTEEGKRRLMYRNRAKSAWKTKGDVEDIMSTWNEQDFKRFDMDPSKPYLTLEQGSNVAKRIVIKDGNIPVSFFDIFDIGDGKATVAIGTRRGEEFRNKGYATKAAAKGMQWYDKNKNRIGFDKITWNPMVENTASSNIAEKMGFSKVSSNGSWDSYEKR